MAPFDLVGLTQDSRGIFVNFPVSGSFFFKVCQPFHAVTLSEEIHVYLALPVVEVGEAEGLDEVGDWGEKAAQVFVVVQVQDA